MELTTVTKVNAADARITIIINPENLETSMKLSYTCGGCGGHGCNNHQYRNNECSSGTVYKVLDPANLNAVFADEQLSLVETAISILYNKVFKR